MSGNSTSDRRRFLKMAGAGAFASAIAGCNFGDARDREFEATPYAVSPEGRERFGFTDVAADTVEETREGELFGVDGSVTIVSRVFSYGLEAEAPESSAWRVPSDRSWSAGVVSTPRADIAGEARNPLATQPLVKLLAGDTGQQFKSAMSLKTDRSWECGPERIGRHEGTMLGKETEFESFAGVLESEDGGQVAVAVYAGRVQREGDAVIAGMVDRRPVGPDGQRGRNCLTPSPDPAGGIDEEEAIDIAKGAVARRILREAELVKTIREAEEEDEDPITLPPSPEMNASNLRLVQLVEDSVLTNSTNSLQDPPIVANQPTAVMFDLDPSDVDQLGSDGVKVWIEVSRADSRYTRWMHFWLRPDDLRDIRDSHDTAAKFHELARDGDPETDPPIFAVDPTSVNVEFTRPGSFGGHSTLERASTAVSNTWTLDRTLKVGFIEVTDPKATTGETWDPGDGFKELTTSYGDANGRAANYVRSVNSSYEYIRRVFPGEVVAYRHDTPITAKEMSHEVKSGTPDRDAEVIDDEQAWGRDHIEARSTLNTVVQNSNFPSGGELYHSSLTESDAKSLIDTSGLDVAMVILPQGTVDGNIDYFDAHDVGATGKFIGRKKAVSSEETLADSDHENDVGHATTTAQEIGHYFADHPYRNRSRSTHPFARNSNDTGHANGNLVSVGYTLVDDIFTVPNGFEISDGNFDPGGVPTTGGGDTVHVSHTSYMSYTGIPKWADGRITEYLMKSEFDREYSPSLPRMAGAAGPMSGVADGAGAERTDADQSVEPVIEVYGSVKEGTVAFRRSWAYDGNPVDTPDVDVEGRLRNHDAEPVEVTLVGVDGEAVRETVVPDRSRPTHGDEVFRGFVVSLSFAPGGIWLDAGYRRGEDARLNAVVHPVRDAVNRVPARGLADPEAGRQRLTQTLVGADRAMQAERYGRAASILQEEFDAVVGAEVEPYEPLANEPTAEQLLSLAERQSARLTDL